jgi:cell division protein FtsB
VAEVSSLRAEAHDLALQCSSAREIAEQLREANRKLEASNNAACHEVSTLSSQLQVRHAA